MRLFLGCPLPESWHERIDALQDAFEARGERLRWVPRGNRHLTIRFLGSVTEDAIGTLEDAVDELGSAPRAPVVLTGAGAFPSARRAAVLWVGVDDPEGALGSLAAGAEARVRELGFAPEERTYSPHVTLARLRPPRDLRAAIEEAVAVDAAGELGELVLYASRPSPKGVRYERLVTKPLAAP